MTRPRSPLLDDLFSDARSDGPSSAARAKIWSGVARTTTVSSPPTSPAAPAAAAGTAKAALVGAFFGSVMTGLVAAAIVHAGRVPLPPVAPASSAAPALASAVPAAPDDTHAPSAPPAVGSACAPAPPPAASPPASAPTHRAARLDESSLARVPRCSPAIPIGRSRCSPKPARCRRGSSNRRRPPSSSALAMRSPRVPLGPDRVSRGTIARVPA
jgi:hypothetical protein